MTNRTIYATLTNSNGDTYRLSFVESGNMVFVYSKTNNHGGFKVERFGEKLNRSWVRKFADGCEVTF